MKRYWELACNRIDELSLRERVMVFAAVAFVVVALLNALLLDPLLAKQKTLAAQVIQQQEKAKELQGQVQATLQAMRDDEHSPLRQRIAQLRAQQAEQDGYLQSRRDRLIPPDEMAGLLEQVLNRNGRLQLVALKTLPVGLLIPPRDKTAANAQAGGSQRQIFKHGVQITVRGSYPDLLQYLTALENMQAQMFWGEAVMSVEQYPSATLTLTLYTLSMDKTWLTV
ncbi:MAG: agglutinin biogenesis protein [Gallionellales bacterium GWA2_60_18]|nr:MAG: agglutinin biogenesis protein [Gallionellales bacterium GWA2_60_18]